MIYYFSLFSLFFIFAKITNFSNYKREIYWLISLFALFLILGSRYYIGGDYFGYLNLYNKMDDQVGYFNIIFHNVEILFYSILLVINKLGLGYYFLNFFLAFILIFFFQGYAKKYKNPFFILLIAIPILFIPISINFVRQGIAISIFLYSIQYLISGKYLKYLFLIIIAALFHKFSIIYLLFYFIYEKNFVRIFRYILPLIFFITGIFILSFFINIPLISVWVAKLIWSLEVYSDNNYPIIPKGGIFRLSMICFSFFTLFYFRSFFKHYDEYKLWFTTGLIGIALIPITFFYPFLASRIILFFVPISIFVFGNIIALPKYKKIININVISLFFFIYFLVWINFSPFKFFFTPYESIFFL